MASKGFTIQNLSQQILLPLSHIFFSLHLFYHISVQDQHFMTDSERAYFLCIVNLVDFC